MLHSLFEETPDDRCYNLHLPPKYNQKTDGMSKPSLPCAMRSKCGLSGLDNQGATCYLNSLLQTLLFTPEFRESLMRISHLELETPKVRIIPIQLRRLFARLLLADRHAIQTTELTNSFGWTGVEELVQHDVQELNRILFSAIESSLKGTSGENIIHKLYCGVIVNQIKCLECHSLSEKMEDFQDLTVIVSSMQNLENSLSTTYSTKETMCEGNQYFCGNCLKKVDAEKQTKISSLPSILTFSLMRFSYDFEKRERYKETENFSFPLVLDMEPYCSNISEKEKFVYELFSIVIHNGSGYGGHYHVYIRDVDCLGNWEVTNTAKPELVLEEKAEKSLVPKSFDKNNVLQIFIDILSYQVNFSTHVNNLCLELTKFVGSSWKTLYRKRHGSIIKFLLKHDDVFSLNDLTSIVSLKKGAVKLPKPSSPNPKPVENKPLLDCEKQWFDFNDENIKPVSAKEIEKHFKGNESAYMLFYRQKCLQRPNDAKQNPLYAIPDDLVELVRDENLQDEKDRVVYEDHLNTINLQVSFGAHYRFTNGVLKPVPDTLNTVLFPIDQRKTLGELRDQIYELAPDLCSSRNFSLHFAKELPVGLHLLKEFISDLNETKLINLGVQRNDFLHVSYGDQLSDVPVGENCIPILLCITYISDNKECCINETFPRNMTLGEVKIFLSNETTLNLPITLKFEGKNEDLIDEKTLDNYNLRNGESLIAQSGLDKDMVKIKIYNKFRVSINVKDSDCSCSEMIFPKNVRIEDVKVEVFLRFNLDIIDLPNSRLRNFNDFDYSSREPLYEEDIIENVLKSNMKSLVLEDGFPPTADQITLYFDIASDIKKVPAFSINCYKTLQIKVCIEEMISIANLDGCGNWNLCKSRNWLDELTVIKDHKSTLEDAGLVNGNIVTLQEKVITPPVNSLLKIHLRLYPTPEELHSLNFPPIHSDCVKELIKAIEHATAQIFTYVKGDYISLGTIEIPENELLSQLKSQIMTIPLISNVPITNYFYIRLRYVENDKLGPPIRKHNQTLKQLKLENESIICTQILTTQEELKSDEILLSIALRIPYSNEYLPANDLIWNGNKNFYLKSLQNCISEALDIPVQKLLLAKHIPKKFDWQILTDFSHGKKSNKERGKVNLRQSPFNLKDGDFIGVKNKENDLEWDNFMSEEDVRGKILRVSANFEINNEKLDEEPSVIENRIRGGSLNSPAKVSQLPEVGIKIHVDDFT